MATSIGAQLFFFPQTCVLLLLLLTQFEFPFDVTFSFTFDLMGLLGKPRKGYGNEFFGFLLFCFHSYDLKKKRKKLLQTLPFDLVSLAFLCYFLFWEEKDIKFEQKYQFNPDFNKCELRKTNRIYLRWVKWHFLNHR